MNPFRALFQYLKQKRERYKYVWTILYRGTKK